MNRPLVLVLFLLAIGVVVLLALQRSSDEDLDQKQASPTASPDVAWGSQQEAPSLPALPEGSRERGEQEGRKRSSVPVLRYSASEPGKGTSPKPTPLTGQQLFEHYPMVMSRIQEGLKVENGVAIRKCITDIARTGSVRFDVTVNVVIDGEVGSVTSIEFPEPPDALSDTHKKCLTDVMTSLSFDGMDVAFEGPVNYPFLAIKRPPDEDAQTAE